MSVIEEDLFGGLVDEPVVLTARVGRVDDVPSGCVVAYTDGSSLRNPDGPAGWGWWVDEERYASGGFLLGTNNMGELQAIIEVLRSAPRDIDLLIVSDSKYAIGAAWEWVQGWKARGWVKKDKRIPENLEMVKEADALLSARTGRTYFRHVRGHGRDKNMRPEDVVGNDHADRLATDGSARAERGDPSTQGPGWSTA